LADFVKNRWHRTVVIESLNSIYLSLAVISIIAVHLYQVYWARPDTIALNNALQYWALFLWTYFLLSRCNEIFFAFLRDAFDKLDRSAISHSKLTPKDRIRLSLKSYVELIINFALLYALLPATSEIWCKGNSPIKATKALYFSGVTITTLGYGDISPEHWYPQFLTVYEVFCGFILLIVCFAIYAGKNHDDSNERVHNDTPKSGV
jgi:voltage-gated potassium channel